MGVLISSCGARRNSKRHETPTKPVVVVATKPVVKNTIPITNTPLEYISYFKSVAINEDGSLEWFGEETHPSDSEMTAKLSASQTEYDTNGAKTD